MFTLLDRARITDGSHKGLTGYVTGERVEGGVRLYEVTCGGESYWVPGAWLEGA